MRTPGIIQKPPLAWNKTGADDSVRSSSLHELIEGQVQRTPDQPALVFERQTLTYSELNRRANQLAGRLTTYGVGSDMLVGLMVERSVELMVGILGILKAGAAYVPIDATFPSERIAFLLKDADVKWVLTTTNLLNDLPVEPAHAICLDSFDWTDSEEAPDRGVAVKPENLAYVIYTSGSTGKPKGVAITHSNIVNYVVGICERFELEPGMSYATVSTIAADLGNTVIFPALATGGCLHVISQERATNQATLSEYFSRQRIDVLKIVPSHLAALQAGNNPERVMPRRRLILGGEASRLEWIERLRALAPDCKIYNHYGPTETTVGVITYHVSGDLPRTETGTLPLGKPLLNSLIYILGPDLQKAPVGVEGEIYIGGAGVARGYLNRPELTAERFVPDPFSSEAGARMYRTGDLGRRLPDDNIEFCGRIDHQVKINGYRVELGEVEAALRDRSGVHDVLVVANEDESDSKRLLAYVVPKDANQPLWNSDSVHVLPDGSPVAHLNRGETDYIYQEIFVLQAYLRHGITLEDGDCVVDAGANIGLFTLFVNRIARDLKTISFEPNPAAFKCLQANASAWGANAKCLPVGLSNENKSGDLTFFEGFSLLSGLYADAANERDVVKNYVLNQSGSDKDNERLDADIGDLIDGGLHAKVEQVPLRTLSSVIAEHNIERIDLLKINVEKSELDVLLGIEPADWPKIRQIVLEVDLQGNLEPITTLLETSGYEVLTERDPLLKNTELCYVYAVRSSPKGRLIRQQPADAHVRPVLPLNRVNLTPSMLRNSLKERLPQYMIPSAFVLLDKIPLTANGKIDRQALPSASTLNSFPVQKFAAPRTDTEKKLAVIWADLLRVERIGIHDDFFDLGGHSLLAVKAASQIRKVFEVDLPLATLLQTPTIAGLAEVLGNESYTPSWSLLVPIRPEGGKPALFLMHSHGGNVLEYRALVNAFPADQPVYALQARGLNGHIIQDSSLEEMASAYLGELTQFQSKGPYYLGGFCLGGLLALEMAQQLTASGQDVALVILIQSMHPAATQFKPSTTALHRWYYRATKRISLELENLSNRKAGYFEERRQRAWDFLRAKASLAIKPFNGKDGSAEPLPLHVLSELLRREHAKAMANYQPRSYDGDVALFRAATQLGGLEIDEYLGWKRVLHGNLDVCETPGHQQTLLTEPNVSKLAAEITPRLRAAQQRRQIRSGAAA
jgi:amino acid adenylation domain-containing protein/FkbM family methyltransferase